MDFFGHQDRARLTTHKLLVYYGLAVLCTILSAYGLMVVVLGALEHEKSRPTWKQNEGEFTTGVVAPFPGARWMDPHLFISVTGVTIFLMACGSGWKTMQYARGGGAVATLMGGRPVPPGTSDPDKQRLLNVVEEMAIASGLPVPGVYLLDDEEGINAFAAGHTSSDAVIGVTRGTLEHLTRDELQGVVAHEFSHILNGDMRLNMRLSCMTFGILFLAVVGRTLLESLQHIRFSNNSKDKGGGAILILILAAAFGLMLIGSIGHFFASLIQAAVSRQREFLADAAAIQFTRNPQGIGRALLKIAGRGKKNSLHTAHAMEAGHFFFCDSLASRWMEWGSTHPAIEERIRRIAPDLLEEEMTHPSARRPAVSSFTDGASAFAGSGGTAAGAVPSRPLQWGPPDGAHLAYAARLLEDLPPLLQEAVREPYGARAIVFALLLSPDPEIADSQLRRLARLSEPLLRQEALLLREPIRRLDRRVLLPLVDLAQPTLRLLSPASYLEFRQTLEALVEADQEIGLLEYALLKLVKRRLDPLFGKSAPPVPGDLSWEAARPSVRILLGALAYQNAHPAEAFAQGGGIAGEEPLPEAEHCGLAQADQALESLTHLPLSERPRLMEACARVVMADGTWTAEEGELLRAIGDHLDCPIPPFLSKE